MADKKQHMAVDSALTQYMESNLMVPACDRFAVPDHGYALADDPDAVTCQKQGCLNAVRYARYDRKQKEFATRYVEETFGPDFDNLESREKVALIDAKEAELTELLTAAREQGTAANKAVDDLYEQKNALYSVRPYSRS